MAFENPTIHRVRRISAEVTDGNSFLCLTLAFFPSDKKAPSEMDVFFSQYPLGKPTQADRDYVNALAKGINGTGDERK